MQLVRRHGQCVVKTDSVQFNRIPFRLLQQIGAILPGEVMLFTLSLLEIVMCQGDVLM